MLDTTNRVVTIILSRDKTKVLIGHAPNFKKGPNTWDLVGKGHIEIGEKPSKAAIREIYEESNIRVSEANLKFLDSILYKNGITTVYCYVYYGKEILKCNSFFNFHGHELPEFNEYQWVPIEDLYKWLYPDLEEAIFPIICDLIENIKEGLI